MLPTLTLRASEQPGSPCCENCARRWAGRGVTSPWDTSVLSPRILEAPHSLQGWGLCSGRSWQDEPRNLHTTAGAKQRPPCCRLFGPKRKMTSAIARWHSGARPPSDALELAYADRLEAEMQELAIQLHKVRAAPGQGAAAGPLTAQRQEGAPRRAGAGLRKMGPQSSRRGDAA